MGVVAVAEEPPADHDPQHPDREHTTEHEQRHRHHDRDRDARERNRDRQRHRRLHPLGRASARPLCDLIARQVADDVIELAVRACAQRLGESLLQLVGMETALCGRAAEPISDPLAVFVRRSQTASLCHLAAPAGLVRRPTRRYIACKR
jgi:hypothetical protein